MHKLFPVFITSVAVLLNACNNTSANHTEQTAQADTALAPVETKDPNTTYKPAFAGQTRIRGVKTKTAYESKILSSELLNPWGIATLPDGRFIITQKGGTMTIATTTGALSTPITGIPAVNPAGQGGLLGITIDPAFESNKMIYWVFSENTADGNVTAVGKGKLSVDEKKIENAKTIYRATPAYNGDKHYGGRIIFDKSGNLFISTGERSDLATRPQAQSLSSGLGKVIHITTDGKPVAGGPFSSDSKARPEIYTYGHRNVQGLAFHPVTGDLWEAEFGPRGGDEINIIRPGKNYGWPTITYSLEYSGEKVGEGITQKEGLEQPVYYWDPVISPSGILFYTGNIDEWKNNLFVSSLSGKHIARLIIENNKVTGEERLLSDENQRFRAITQGKDGALYAITDEGRLYRIGTK